MVDMNQRRKPVKFETLDSDCLGGRVQSSGSFLISASFFLTALLISSES